MTENLAYLPSVGPSSSGSTTVPSYYVNGYQGSVVIEAKLTANYATYGVLYNWPAARTACPSDWHLPTDAEWSTLTNYLTNNGHGFGGSGIDIGKSMASVSGWSASSTAGIVGNSQATNNSSGFNALPAGFRGTDGGFAHLGNRAYFWSDSEGDVSNAWYRYLIYDRDGLGRFDNNRSYGFSVRCLKDCKCQPEVSQSPG